MTKFEAGDELKRHTTLDHLSSDLMYAREEYLAWCRTSELLTRDERAAKIAAEKKVSMLENAKARTAPKLCFCRDFSDNPTNFREE